MDRKIKGFSLIELLVAIAIMAIALSIGIPSILNWIAKYRLEGDTQKIYAFLQEARAKAFAEKIKLDITLNGNQLCMKCDTNDTTCTNSYGTGSIRCITLHNTFSGNSINISKRGTFSGGSIYYPQENNAKYDCVIISDIRIKMEKCNGNRNP